jgi:hypothetical protein
MDTQPAGTTERKQIRGKYLDSLTPEEILALIEDAEGLTEEDVATLEQYCRGFGMRMTQKHLFWFLGKIPEVMTFGNKMYQSDEEGVAFSMGWAYGAYQAFFGNRIGERMSQIELTSIARVAIEAHKRMKEEQDGQSRN